MTEHFPILPKPRFALTRLGSPAGTPPEIARVLAEVGIPKSMIGYEYLALPEAEILDAGRLIAFGTCGAFGRVAIDAGTGRIVHVPTAEATAASGVNSDLAAFTRCVAAVVGRFPFYEEDAGPEECARVAGEIRDLISAIDDGGYADDGFWGVFGEDVAEGYYCDWDDPRS
ncbi:SUKH-4 family immunity protein [Actinoplanes sp. NPDC023714]|uniref:SUKH-4 family immunity protein n=1 Tax=Actinoplanes sp. NPDC023714 TaxID=3154322 RepID=UPI0033DDB65A